MTESGLAALFNAPGLRERGSARFETHNRTCDGCLLPVEVTLHFVPAADELPDRIIAFVLDISERKAVERALIATKEAAEAANVARAPSWPICPTKSEPRSTPFPAWPT